MARPQKRELVSQREYARRRGISHVAVHRAIASGRISTVDGKIDPVVADREWEANTDQSKPRNRITGRPKHARAPGTPPEPMGLGLTGGGGGGEAGAEPFRGESMETGYSRARAARELYQAQLAKIEVEQKRGLLVRVDEVRIGAANMACRTRGQLIAMPERRAAVLAGVSDPVEVQRLLEEEVERICLELSDAERP